MKQVIVFSIECNVKNSQCQLIYIFFFYLRAITWLIKHQLECWSEKNSSNPKPQYLIQRKHTSPRHCSVITMCKYEFLQKSSWDHFMLGIPQSHVSCLFIRGVECRRVITIKKSSQSEVQVEGCCQISPLSNILLFEVKSWHFIYIKS